MQHETRDACAKLMLCGTAEMKIEFSKAKVCFRFRADVAFEILFTDQLQRPVVAM